jgi:hypothetical protein
MKNMIDGANLEENETIVDTVQSLNEIQAKP